MLRSRILLESPSPNQSDSVQTRLFSDAQPLHGGDAQQRPSAAVVRPSCLSLGLCSIVLGRTSSATEHEPAAAVRSISLPVASVDAERTTRSLAQHRFSRLAQDQKE